MDNNHGYHFIHIHIINMQDKTLIGTHRGGKDRLAEWDQKDPDQPAETTQRSQHISCDLNITIFSPQVLWVICDILCFRRAVFVNCSVRADADADFSSPVRQVRVHQFPSLIPDHIYPPHTLSLSLFSTLWLRPASAAFSSVRSLTKHFLPKTPAHRFCCPLPCFCNAFCKMCKQSPKWTVYLLYRQICSIHL